MRVVAGAEGGAGRAVHAQERLAGALAGTWAVQGSGGGGGVFGMKRSALKQCVVVWVGWGGGAGSELGRDAGRAIAGRGARGASRPALSAPRTAAPTAAAAAADAGGGWWWRRGLSRQRGVATPDTPLDRVAADACGNLRVSRTLAASSLAGFTGSGPGPAGRRGVTATVPVKRQPKYWSPLHSADWLQKLSRWLAGPGP